MVRWVPDSVLRYSADHTLKLLDARTGKCLRTFIHGPNGETACIDEVENRFLSASSEAWRFLGWQWIDPESGESDVLPVEHFGFSCNEAEGLE